METPSPRTKDSRRGILIRFLDEVRESFTIHANHGTIVGGIHLELTGNNVTECIGGAGGLSSDRSGTGLRKQCRSALELRTGDGDRILDRGASPRIGVVEETRPHEHETSRDQRRRNQRRCSSRSLPRSRACSEGEVVSFGDVAALAGRPGAARAAGAVLANSADTLPWWRVVYSDGHLPPCNPGLQAERLADEGVELSGFRVIRRPRDGSLRSSRIKLLPDTSFATLRYDIGSLSKHRSTN